MNAPIYWLGRLLITLVQALPLRFVARVGRVGGAAAYRLLPRYRRVALDNLTRVFGGEKSPDEIRSLALENFCRIGENYASAIKTAGMTWHQLRSHVDFVGFDALPVGFGGVAPPNIVGAIGHFGNFELYARVQHVRPDYQSATTYRGLNQPGANRLLKSLRNRSGCLFFERRTEGGLLRDRMAQGGVLLGLLADQNSQGMYGPFLGHDCQTGLAPAVLALRYNARLITVICYRTSLAHWRIQLGREIPTHENNRPRPSAEIMRDVNLALEAAVRHDPANWFWVHRRWKAGDKRREMPASTV